MQQEYTIEQEAYFSRFKNWINKYAPNVAKMEEPFTIGQYFVIREKYSRSEAQKILLEMHNWKPLLQKTISAFHTFMVWKINKSKPKKTTALQREWQFYASPKYDHLLHCFRKVYAMGKSETMNYIVRIFFDNMPKEEIDRLIFNAKIIDNEKGQDSPLAH